MGKRARPLIVRMHFVDLPVVGLERNERQNSSPVVRCQTIRGCTLSTTGATDPPPPFSTLPQVFI